MTSPAGCMHLSCAQMCALHNMSIGHACSDLHLSFVEDVVFAASKTSLHISIVRDPVLAHKLMYVLQTVKWSVFTP